MTGSGGLLGEFGDDDFVKASDSVERVLHRASEFRRQVVELFAADVGHLEVLGQSDQFQTHRVVNLGRRRRRRVAVAVGVQIQSARFDANAVG